MRVARDSNSRRDAWTQALEQFRLGLARYLAHRLYNAQTAEDLAQEVYLRLLRVANPERVKSPQAYVYRVAANALQEFRAREESSIVTFDSERAGGVPRPIGTWLRVGDARALVSNRFGAPHGCAAILNLFPFFTGCYFVLAQSIV